MKIKFNEKLINQELRRFLLIGSLSLVPLSLSGCDNTYSENSEEVVYESGEHKLLEVDRNMELFWGKSGTYELIAPEGYKVVEYDYDYVDDFSYDDYVYVNTEEVIVTSKDEFGAPTIEKEQEDNTSDGYIYRSGEHNLVDINRGVTLFGKLSRKKDLEVPNGYEIIDYDYDVSGNLDFENITYTNITEIKTKDANEFGIPTTELENKEEKDYYLPGEHKIVEINRNVNLMFGKNGEKTITAPEGYEIIDYDYDKLDSTEYETIIYTNTVKVSKVDNDFGKPLEDVNDIDEALVVIDGSLNLFIGFDKLKEVEKKEGYDLIDYDYDKNESFEFETYVYKKVKNSINK